MNVLYFDEIKIYNGVMVTTTTTTPQPITTTTTSEPTTTPAPSMQKIRLMDIVSESPVDVNMRNFMIATNSDIRISAGEAVSDISLKCYGCNFIAREVVLVNNDNIEIKDVVMKADSIVEQFLN